MNNDRFYIHCEDDGGTAIVGGGERATDDNGKSAIMVNPTAAATVIIDAAHTRAERIERITAPFSFISSGNLDGLPSDVIEGFLMAVNGISHEVVALLKAAQLIAHHESKGTNHE